MCTFEMHMQCYDRFFEVVPNEKEHAELAVEDGVSQVLLKLFGGGSVDDVTIHFSSHLHMGLQHCSIHIRAQCSCQNFVLLPHTKENIKLEVEKSMGSLLRELFGSGNIGNVTFSPACDYGNDLAFSHCG